jgi:two-component system, NarL family, nitrate/nitrite response regulator NarL
MSCFKSQTVSLSAPAAANRVNSRINGDAPEGRTRTRSQQRIRLLIADDHPFVRRGIVSCLEQRPNLEIVAEAADGQEALTKARELSPDVVLTDLEMPHLSGLALTVALRKESPKIKVLIVSAHASSDCVLRCAQAGANGYVLKQGSLDEYVQAIECVFAGQPFFSPEVAHSALTRMVRGNGQGPDLGELTNREREVLAHIAEGLCNKEIGCRLNIGTRTVETHRERLMRKLNIHSIAGLTRFAIAEGLISVPELAMA